MAALYPTGYDNLFAMCAHRKNIKKTAFLDEQVAYDLGELGWT